ncbi:MAG TPA: heme biosynthesis HemY N-terminal domain-containing protein [Rhodopila sp.]|uniref:heme biosynthesis HemY N-terminal domain-containing protein n=1 Tax=Rhodopila sp. TaxID=2480087 RepID=UPI002CFFD60B|nr:heme biosynthesis HemY N-terminal domain-containing protein [Rhodopila sp.]HVY16284.1 heme biosynthesis HemY N-terminal domain-containing protein [Rhodopila sp.]
MRRLLAALIVGIVIVTVVWLLAGISGHVSASFGPYDVETSVPVAILGIVVLLFAVVLLLRLLVGLWFLPGTTARWRRAHRMRVGQRALNRVLVALASGEQAEARRSARRARRLLGDNPQTLLLAAEAGRLEGREDEAESAFRALVKQPEGQFLGYRGLMRQAIERRDWAEATALARQAEMAHPGTAWLRQQRAELALQTDNWADALDLIGSDPRRVVYYIAAAEAESDPKRALEYARKAYREDPTFAPAVVTYAQRLRLAGHDGRARSTIQEAWARAPHPDFAALMLATETDKMGRLQAAKRLVERNPTHPESRLLVAQAALDAGVTTEARMQIEAARAHGVNQRRVYLLLADLEEQEHGETEAGRQAQRAALRAAATAEPDPHWLCTNCSAEPVAWQPKCPVCSHVGTLRWVATTKTGPTVPAVIAPA